MNKKHTPYDIRNWQKTIRHLMRVEHFTKSEAVKVVQERFNVSARTVACYTSPGMYKFPSAYKKNVREYNTFYVRVRRHINDIIPHIFYDNEELGLKELSNRIYKLKGVRFMENTLEKFLSKYQSDPKGAPIVKTASGHYQLNSSFYNP